MLCGSVRRWLLKMRVGEDLAWVVGGEVEGSLEWGLEEKMRQPRWA